MGSGSKRRRHQGGRRHGGLHHGRRTGYGGRRFTVAGSKVCSGVILLSVGVCLLIAGVFLISYDLLQSDLTVGICLLSVGGLMCIIGAVLVTIFYKQLQAQNRLHAQAQQEAIVAPGTAVVGQNGQTLRVTNQAGGGLAVVGANGQILMTTTSAVPGNQPTNPAPYGTQPAPFGTQPVELATLHGQPVVYSAAQPHDASTQPAYGYNTNYSTDYSQPIADGSAPQPMVAYPNLPTAY